MIHQRQIRQLTKVADEAARFALSWASDEQIHAGLRVYQEDTGFFYERTFKSYDGPAGWEAIPKELRLININQTDVDGPTYRAVEKGLTIANFTYVSPGVYMLRFGSSIEPMGDNVFIDGIVGRHSRLGVLGFEDSGQPDRVLVYTLQEGTGPANGLFIHGSMTVLQYPPAPVI